MLAAFFVLCSLFARSGTALGILIFSLMVWPEYLRIPIFIIQFSIPRLVVIAILAKFVMAGRYRHFHFNIIDTLVICLWVWIIAANLLAGSPSAQISQQIGNGLDTMLVYFAARVCIQTELDLKRLLLPVVLISMVMCFFGLLESITASSPYMELVYHQTIEWFEKPPEFRLGLLRAKVSASVHIYFGLGMVMIAGILWATRRYQHKKKILKIGVLSACLAALTSVSSGPWLALAAFIGCNLLALKPHVIKPMIWVGILGIIFLEVASNRHFYNLIDYLALNSNTAWYRARLIDVAILQLHEYWLLGVGPNTISHWAPMIDGRRHVDVVNHFLIVALNGGLMAMFLYISVHILAIRNSVRKWKRTHSLPLKSLLFTLVSLIVAVDFASMSVSMFGPPLLLSNILLGMTVSCSHPKFGEKQPKPVPVSEEVKEEIGSRVTSI